MRPIAFNQINLLSNEAYTNTCWEIKLLTALGIFQKKVNFRAAERPMAIFQMFPWCLFDGRISKGADTSQSNKQTGIAVLLPSDCLDQSYCSL